MKVGVLSLTSVICTRRLPVVACKNKRYDLDNFSNATSYFYTLAFTPISKSRPERFDSMRNGAVAKLFYAYI